MFDTFNYELLKISFTSVRHQHHYVNLSQNCSPIITDWVFKEKYSVYDQVCYRQEIDNHTFMILKQHILTFLVFKKKRLKGLS